MSNPSAKKPTRTRQPKEQRVKDILDAAEQVFHERGYEKATVAEIAERVGIVEGTVFRYFKGKHELVLQITTRWYSKLFEELVAGLKGITGTRNRLRYIIWSQLTAMNEKAELTGVIILAARGLDKAFTRDVNALYSEYTRPLIQVLDAGMKTGDVKKSISPELVSHMLYGGIEQLLWKTLDDGGKLDVEQIADDMMDLIFGGIVQSVDGKSDGRNDALIERLELLINQ
ncbi:MAG: TetR/AcrR family transcriptional regulator [Halioglobus sp.]